MVGRAALAVGPALAMALWRRLFCRETEAVSYPVGTCERSEQGKLASVASKLASSVNSLDFGRLLLYLFYVIEHFLRGSCHSHGDTTVSPKRRILAITCYLSLIII